MKFHFSNHKNEAKQSQRGQQESKLSALSNRKRAESNWADFSSVNFNRIGSCHKVEDKSIEAIVENVLDIGAPNVGFLNHNIILPNSIF